MKRKPVALYKLMDVMSPEGGMSSVSVSGQRRLGSKDEEMCPSNVKAPLTKINTWPASGHGDRKTHSKHRTTKDNTM